MPRTFGPLVLPGPPTAASHAASKGYVDGRPTGALTPVAVSGPYTASPNDLVMATATDGAVTVTPPPAPAAGAVVAVVKVDSSANAVTWNGPVNSDSTGAQLVSQWAAATFCWTGSVWLVLSAPVMGGTPYTDAQAQNAAAASIASGTHAGISFTYNATTKALSATVATPIVSGNTQTAAYTLALSDAGRAVEMNSASANTLTVPPNSAVAFPVGTVIEVCQYGAGQTTIAAGAGVTVRTASSLTTRARYSTVSLRQRATDEWVAAGDTT